MAAVESVQPAVGVLLQKEKVRGVVLHPVGVQVAEDAHAGLFLGKQQPAKVAAELLDAGTDGNEVVVGAEIGDLLFDERFLQSDVPVGTRCALTDIDVDDPALPRPQLIYVEGGREPDLPVDRLEAGVAVKEIEGETNRLFQRGLSAASEKL